MNFNQKAIFISLALTVAIGANVNTVVKYENKVDDMNKTIGDKQKEIDELEKNKRVLMDQVYNKNSQLEKQRGEIKGLKEDNNELNKNNEDLRKKIKVKDDEIHRLKDKVNRLSISSVNTSKSNTGPNMSGSNKSSHSSGKVDYYEVTAYHAGYESTGKSPGDKGYGKTASGAYVQEGVTIACPPHIPFGTKINIESVGTRICQDRGGAIKGKILDLYIADRDRVWQWGRKKLKIEILN